MKVALQIQEPAATATAEKPVPPPNTVSGKEDGPQSTYIYIYINVLCGPYIYRVLQCLSPLRNWELGLDGIHQQEVALSHSFIIGF